jgi:hypothetical protein
MGTMYDADLLEARRNQARRHDLRLGILALANQGKSMDPEDLHRELPTHPALVVIDYHLLVLRQADLLPPTVH